MIKKLFVFTAIIFTVNMSFGQTTEVAEAVTKLNKLMVTPDSVALDRIILNNLSYGHSSGKVETKQQFLQSLLSGSSDFVDIVLTDQTIIIQKKTALVRHTLSAKTNDKNIPGNVKLHILQIWSKEKGGWKLLGRQAVKTP